jgi:putative heme-binding domain-containing protein
VPLLRKLLADKKSSALGRLHALHALEGLGALTEADTMNACKDEDETVRANGLQLLEPFLKESADSYAALASLAKDRSIHVRYQLAFTLGEIKSAKYPSRVANLLAIIKQDPANNWMQAAVFSSLAEGSGEMFSLAVADSSMRVAGKDFLRQLVELIGAKNNPDDVKLVLNYLDEANEPALSFSLLRALGNGLKRAGVPLEKLAGNFKPLLNRATIIATDANVDEATRLQAIQLLAISTYADAGKSLVSLLEQNQSQAIQLAVVDSLGHFSDSAVATDLSQRFTSMTPQVRSAMLTVLLARPERVAVLLNTLEQGTIRPSDLSSSQIKFLKNHRDAGIKMRAAKIFANVGTARRADVVQSFQPALTLTGNVAHGKAIYLERCSSCHRLEGAGFALGPDLVTVKNSGKEKLLANILDPNREVAPNYKAFEVETKDDESLIGLVANETATSITLRQAFGKENVILRSQIKKLQSQENSLMPEGLEAGLKPQDFADLIEYISNANAGK